MALLFCGPGSSAPRSPLSCLQRSKKERNYEDNARLLQEYHEWYPWSGKMEVFLCPSVCQCFGAEGDVVMVPKGEAPPIGLGSQVFACGVGWGGGGR